jgi:hypothetical protein
VFVLSFASERIRAVVLGSAPVAHVRVIARQVGVCGSNAAAVTVLDEAWSELVLGYPGRGFGHLVKLVYSIADVAPAPRGVQVSAWIAEDVFTNVHRDLA